MIGLLLIFFLLTAIILFWSIFKVLFLSENKVQDRVQHYLSMNDVKRECPGKRKQKIRTSNHPIY
ncbi:hypothetical protein QF028_004024 [Neobacillus sp. B4I6]|jgi:hypothetical protein|uniref:hypothetical protein n=1 Tax=Neobacillus sp. B4I6 TaxID=3373925 RepID=UPI003D1A6CCD